MNAEEYATKLGKLVANLISLELVLRAYFIARPGAAGTGLPAGVDVFELPEGYELVESDLTSWASLGGLVQRFNADAVSHGEPPIDSAIVDLRDAIAHGRISASAPRGSPMRLLKFDRPRDGKVRITLNVALTADWFSDQTRRVAAAITAIGNRCPTVQS
jgi:hypothetical protein